MRYSKDHKQETRGRLLKEAAREIRAKGPGGVAVGGIMARAGLTHGGFYAHFKSKDDLIAEAIGTMFDDARVRFHRNGGASAGDWLSGYIDFYLSKGHRDARDRGCPLAAIGADLPRMEGLSRARFTAGLDSLTSLIADALGAHDADDPRMGAASMVAELVGALTMARAVDDPARSDAILAQSAHSLRTRFKLKCPS